MVIKKALEITENYGPEFTAQDIIGSEPTADNFDYCYLDHDNSMFYNDDYINDYQTFMETETGEISYYEDSSYYDGKSWEGQTEELNITAERSEKPFPPSTKKYFADWTEEYKKAKSALSNIEEIEAIKGLKLLGIEANKGNLYAMYDIAGYLYPGIIMDKDEERATTLYKQIYNEFSTMHNQNIYIHYRLGRMYKMGLGLFLV